MVSTSLLGALFLLHIVRHALAAPVTIDDAAAAINQIVSVHKNGNATSDADRVVQVVESIVDQVLVASRYDAEWSTTGYRVQYKPAVVNWTLPSPANVNTSLPVSDTAANATAANCASANDTASANNATTSSMFQFTFQCNLGDQTMCDKAQRAFESAGARLSRVLDLTQPVQVLAKFNSFCKMGKCADNTLGRAGAASFWTMPGAGAFDNGYLYPQALAKQLSEGQQRPWSQYDIIADFNSDSSPNAAADKFWFEGDAPIVQNQYDFEYVVLHEMMHGLGFISSWGVYFSDPQDSGSTMPLVTPPPAAVPSSTTGLFAPLLVFDSLIVNLANASQSFQNVSAAMSRAAYSSDITSASGSAHSLAADMYTQATTPMTFALSLDANSNDYAVIDTREQPFCTGSSLSHLDLELYTDTPDALMRPQAANGKTLAMFDAWASEWSGGAIGPLTVRVLKRMGYKVKVDPVTTNTTSWQDYVNKDATAHSYALESSSSSSAAAPAQAVASWPTIGVSAALMLLLHFTL
ncbi:hypothetical protein RI367_005981 [Sorochytrium milnesiophthora]